MSTMSTVVQFLWKQM